MRCQELEFRHKKAMAVEKDKQDSLELEVSRLHLQLEASNDHLEETKERVQTLVEEENHQQKTTEELRREKKRASEMIKELQIQLQHRDKEIRGSKRQVDTLTQDLEDVVNWEESIMKEKLESSQHMLTKVFDSYLSVQNEFNSQASGLKLLLQDRKDNSATKKSGSRVPRLSTVNEAGAESSDVDKNDAEEAIEESETAPVKPSSE